MAAGRIQCLLIATKKCEVVYERFYDVFNDTEKAQIRAAFAETVMDESLTEGQEIVGRFKYVPRTLAL